MLETDKVRVRGDWLDPDQMVRGYAYEGIIPERQVTAREFVEITQRFINQCDAVNIPQRPSIDDISDNAISEDPRLDHHIKATFVHSSVQILEGRRDDRDPAKRLQLNGYSIINCTTEAVYTSSSDGQCLQLPHVNEDGLINKQDANSVISLMRTITYTSMAALDAEYDSLKKLQATGGLSSWKELLLALISKKNLEGGYKINWMNPVHFTIEFKINLSDIKKYGVIYDPHTDLTFTAQNYNIVVQAHPGHIVQRTSQVLLAYLKTLDDNQTQFLKIVVRGDSNKVFYQRVNGVIQSLGCVNDIQRPAICDGVIQQEMLDEYLEVHVKAKSTYVRDGVGFRRLSEDDGVVLLHRYSLETALKERIVFSTPEQADALGDVDGKEERLDKIRFKQEETRLNTQYIQEKSRSEELVRKANEKRAEAEAEISRLRAQAESDLLLARREAEMQASELKRIADVAAREHEREMAALKRQMQQDEHRLKMESAANANRAQESKASVENVKLWAAGIALVATVVTVAVKLIPTVSKFVFSLLSLF